MSKKIKKVNLSEQIFELIQNDILAGKYNDGDKLPTEKELMDLYGVSRLTVRGAIQRLNAIGIVQTKAGDGTYIKKFNVESYLKEVSTRIIKPEMLNDVKEFRSLIESACVELAIKNASSDELNELKNASEEFFKIINNNKEMNDEKLDMLAECDYKIHLCICKLSKNSLYILAYMAAQEAIKLYLRTIIESRYLRSQELGLEDSFEKSFQNHYHLYEAIKERDIKTAKGILKNMIDYRVLAFPIDHD